MLPGGYAGLVRGVDGLVRGGGGVDGLVRGGGGVDGLVRGVGGVDGLVRGGGGLVRGGGGVDGGHRQVLGSLASQENTKQQASQLFFNNVLHII